MIKVYYNKYQFLEGEEKGVKNIDGELLADVSYVPSTNNKIVIGDSEEDKKDWEKFSASLKAYLTYFEEVLMVRLDEEQKNTFKEGTRLLEDNFVIIHR